MALAHLDNKVLSYVASRDDVLSKDVSSEDCVVGNVSDLSDPKSPEVTLSEYSMGISNLVAAGFWLLVFRGWARGTCSEIVRRGPRQ